jgi:Flp pilus assembly protein TadG
MRRGRFSLARRFARDRRGVAALEFALVVPIVIVVYAAGFEIVEASTVYRKLTDTTVQLANVTAQYTSVTTTDVTNIFGASSQIMSPYSTTPLTVVLSEVQVNASGQGVVQWSEAYQGATALTKSSTVTMPTGFQNNGDYYLIVQTTYDYSPVIGSAFVQPINMSNKIYMLPRQSTNIPCTVAGTTNSC